MLSGEVAKKFGITLKSINDIYNQDAVIISVGHKGYTKGREDEG
mgnify:CR=1 FL=1